MARKTAIIGLGYAGLHTALAFGKKSPVIGFDVDVERIRQLQEGYDCHLDFSKEVFRENHIHFTSDKEELKSVDFFIIIVPTPVTPSSQPDLSYLQMASELVGEYLKKDDIVVYESTVYPGATEEVCVPLLEKYSSLVLKRDFAVGYSPERINPGDKVHTFGNTPKIVAGSDEHALAIITEEYSQVTEAQIVPVSNIRTAEAVKIVENIQRDVNIALMNELSVFFHLTDIDIHEVINAAKTKWNFMPFSPGLVGGHCVSVDPYYLIFKAHELGFFPDILTSSRKVNESMPGFIAKETVKLLLGSKGLTSKPKVGILGITFKEDYLDVRNSKVVNLGKELEKYHLTVCYFDPVANKEMVKHEHGIELIEWDDFPRVATLILAVAHREIVQAYSSRLAEKLLPGGIVIDVKGALKREQIESQGFRYWRF